MFYLVLLRLKKYVITVARSAAAARGEAAGILKNPQSKEKLGNKSN